MKTMIWAAAASIGILTAVVFLTKAPEPASADTDSPRLVRIGEMSVARATHQATLLASGQVLITGGCAGRGCERVLSSAEIYDPDTRTFRSVAPMATPRAGHAAVALPDGRVLLLGGWTGQSATASAEVYDPATDRMISAGEMGVARMDPVAVPLADGRVLIVGGERSAGETVAAAEIFAPATSTFSAVGRMKTPRSAHAAVRLQDGRVLVIGGHRARGEVLRTAEIFDPATGKFQPAGMMAVPRHKHAAVLLPDGRVLIVGGSDARDYRGRYASTEIFNPTTGEFSPGPDMQWRRHKIRDAVAVFPSGAVLVAGGATRAEFYSPAGTGFVPVNGTLSGPQMFATATLLPSGDVLVLGGYDDRIQPSASAWLVRP